MASATNLIRRGGSANYWLRAFVPKELQPLVGKKEVWRSLRTTDRNEAKRRLRAVLDQLEAEWEGLKLRRQIGEDEIATAVWQRYTSIIAADERFRSELPSDEDLDDIWQELVREFGEDHVDAYRILEIIRETAREDRDRRTQRLSVLRRAIENRETKPAADAVKAVLGEHGVQIERSDPAYKKLASSLVRAEIEAFTRTIERDRANFGGRPSDPIVKPPARPVATKDQTVMAMFDRYARENPKGERRTRWIRREWRFACSPNSLGRNSRPRPSTKRRSAIGRIC